ncbi:MAG: hypothetical protein ABIO70_23345 [Pseudomonadota bacterium]
MFLLLVTAALASDYDVLRAEAQVRQALLRGDTGVLITLAGEDGCIAAEDPEDCAATAAPVADKPLLELIPVPAIALPPLGDAGPSLLLPRFPYGLEDPVTLLLGPPLPQPPAPAWVRVAVPDGVALPPGPHEVQLLLRLDPIGPQVLPWASPAPAEAPSGRPEVVADGWGTTLTPPDRLQVLLPARIAAIRLLLASGTVDLAWPEAPPQIHTQPLIEPAWSLAATQRMLPAVSLCAHAWFAHRARRPHGGPPIPPADLPAPLLAVLLDPLGQVQDAVPIARPWTAPEPAACLRANLRLQPAAERGGAVDLLLLSAPDELR